MVWNFRLQRSAVQDKNSQIVDVELRSSSKGFLGITTKGIVGSLYNGDVVAVDASGLKEGELLRVKELWSLTTNSSVRVRGSSPSRALAMLDADDSERQGVIRGRIATLQQRQSRPGMIYGPTVWSFRLQRNVPAGRWVPLVEAEMLGSKFEGSLAVGDEVELDASRCKSGEVVVVKKARNLTANSVVRVH